PPTERCTSWRRVASSSACPGSAFCGSGSCCAAAHDATHCPLAKAGEPNAISSAAATCLRRIIGRTMSAIGALHQSLDREPVSALGSVRVERKGLPRDAVAAGRQRPKRHTHRLSADDDRTALDVMTAGIDDCYAAGD